MHNGRADYGFGVSVDDKVGAQAIAFIAVVHIADHTRCQKGI